MSTLLQLRTRLNAEIGVVSADDATDAVYPQADRNQAVSDAFAELWRQGIWKSAKQDISTVDNTWIYALTAIRRLRRLESLDSSGKILSEPRGVVEDDGIGGYQVRLASPVAGGLTLRVWGWGPYVSTFANDAAVDDIPAEYERVPLLKAKAILYRNQAAKFMRYGERQAAPPEMNTSLDQILGMIAAAEREFAEAVRAWKAERPRTGQVLGV